MKFFKLTIIALLIFSCTKENISPDNQQSDKDDAGYAQGKLKTMNLANIGFKQDHKYEYYTDRVIEIENGMDYQTKREHLFNDSFLRKIIYTCDDPDFIIDSTTFSYKDNSIEKIDFLNSLATIHATFHLVENKCNYSIHYYENHSAYDSCLYKWDNEGRLLEYEEYTYLEGDLVSLEKIVFTYTNILNPIFKTNILDIQTMYKSSFGGYDFMDFNQNCVEYLVDEIKLYTDDKLIYTLDFQYETNSSNYPTDLRLIFYQNNTIVTFYDYKFDYYD